MKRKSAEIKRIARGNLTGHYGTPMGAMVVAELIQTIPLLFFSMNLTVYSGIREWIIYYVAAFILGLIGIVLASGNARIALSMCRRKEYRFRDLFYCFVNHPDKYILAYLLMTVIMLLPMVPAIICMLLAAGADSWVLYVIGIVLMLAGYVFVVILALSYALTYMLLLDNPDMRITEALRESKSMMWGNKGRLFYIELSFIGWILLGMLSAGVGLLWIMPYMTQTHAVFYLDLLGEYDRIIQPQSVDYEQQPNYQNMWN